MSSSFVLEPQESGSKKDDTLIIVVSDDGTISVDQETLQNLIMNQSNANVSVVRVGQTDGDAASGDLTMTVDPPAPFVSPETAINAASTATADPAGLVDPFMEMDPEQLEKLSTALQSEQAKQILGENVTAMLDMLTVEEQQKSIKYCIELDHCYTSRTSPSDPEPSDPLPIANSPDIDDSELKHSPLVQQPPSTPTSTLIPPSFAESAEATAPVTRLRIVSNRPLLRPVITRGRKTTGPVSQQVSPVVAKPPGTPVLRNSTIAAQTTAKGTAGVRTDNEAEHDGLTTSSESSESEPPSDDDSDFGPRGPRRGGVRARGGRKGITTRGGSMAATRRRGPNKQMDMEQVRRLDMEMAAAVDAMKSPEKTEKSTERFSPVKTKKQTRSSVAGGKKKDEPSPNRGAASGSAPISSPAAITEIPPLVYEKPLQTTNQVKANLISANMIKGDMILTKPGQMRNNQKVTIVQKKVIARANEMRNLGSKKQSLSLTKGGKTVSMQLQTKIGFAEDGKLVSIGGKTIGQNLQDSQQPSTPLTPISTFSTPPETPNPQETGGINDSAIVQPHQLQPTPQQPQMLDQNVQQPQEQQQKQGKISTGILPIKSKTPEAKKEKKKLEVEATTKIEEAPKPVETKVTDASKKVAKKETRKSPAVTAIAFGPALFSTPDIIRRVSGGSESKPSDVSPPTPTTPVPPQLASVSASSATEVSSPVRESDVTPSADVRKSREEISPNETRTADVELEIKPSIADASPSTSLPSSRLNSDELKDEMRVPTAEELQPSLDPVANVGLAESDPELARPAEEGPVAPNDIATESSGIEGEEHLLATLEMEASKHEEELLAEALLLQEELGVDLADHGGLVEPTASLPENLLSTTAFDAPMETAEGQIPPVAKTVEPAKNTDPATNIPSIEAEPATNVAPQTPTTSAMASPSDTARKRDDKEPIQIVRGGRVITLPPIEAPATRSKRLQVKVDTPQKPPETPKKEDKALKQMIQQQQQLLMAQQHMKEIEEMESEMDDDDDDEEDDENSDSEDDPDRLWCICKRPHNNRFMICCDVCEDWFHGKCVHVSKAMGQQMEEKGIEWVCPNCTKKKEQDSGVKTTKTLEFTPVKPAKMEIIPRTIANQPPTISIQKSIPSPSEKVPAKLSSVPDQETTATPVSGVTQCVVCKKEARNSSIYCSDACILMHAQETFTKDTKQPAAPQKKISQVTNENPKPTADARVIVFERRTGKVLTGSDAPTTSNFKTWLKENPTFEVVRPNNLNTLQIGGKTVTAIQTQGVGKMTNKTAPSTPGATPKMVYTKVVGSKQTVLAPSNKKIVLLSGLQQRASISPKTVQSPQHQQKQSPGTISKNPGMRQTTIKILSPQIKSPATISKPPPTPKSAATKKSEPKTPGPQQQSKIVQKTPPVKKTEPEPIRLNVRKTLTELLTTRIKETQDLKLKDEEISELALNIELELYKYFRDTGAKYKAKYRSLVFNIKDTKNLTLFRKIADRSLTPDAVVRLSPDEMASQELAEWREKETKHQLEMIKKNELDLMAQAKSIVVKTHKGEQIIENEGGIDHVDPKTPVQDIVMALNSQEPISEIHDDKDEKNLSSTFASFSGTSTITTDDKKKSKTPEERRNKEKQRENEKSRSKEKDKSREKKEDRNHGRGHRGKDRDKSREKNREDRKTTKSKDDQKREGKSGRERDRERDRDRERGKDREKVSKEKDRTRKSRNGRGGQKDHNGREKDKKDDDRKRDGGKKIADASGNHAETEKSIEDRLWRHVEEETTTNTFDGNDSDVSDREPSSTVNIKTPDINEDSERSEKDNETSTTNKQTTKGPWQTVWRGFVNMVDVAKFFITAQEVSGHAKDLMEDLPDTVDVVGRISHETVWDYISKMKKSGSKEILVIRLTAANDEEKIPYITLYSYLNSRSRLGVVGNVSKNIKDFYIMPFSRQSQIPSVLLPLIGPGFEEQRPHLLLGIIVRNKRKRFSTSTTTSSVPSKITKKDNEEIFSSQNVVGAVKEKIIGNLAGISDSRPTSPLQTQLSTTLPPSSPRSVQKELLLESLREKQKITQMTLDSLNKAHVGMSRNQIDNSSMSKIVPELTTKIDASTDSPKDVGGNDETKEIVAEDEKDKEGGEDEDGRENSEDKKDEDDDGDEPYSPGEIDDDNDDNSRIVVKSNLKDNLTGGSILSPIKNSTELQRKMDELNRQIEEQKQQIQSISSSFLGDATTTLPGLGQDPPEMVDMDEAYSPTDARSFTPPPQGITKFSQPIFDKVSDITIPPNLQEILANVKRQETSKVDPYLPSKPSATFLTSVNTSNYPKIDKYTPSFIKNSTIANDRQSTMEKTFFDNIPLPVKETKSTLGSLSESDLIKKAEEELAAVAAATAAAEAAAAEIAAAAAAAAESEAQAIAKASTMLTTTTSTPPPPLPPPLNVLQSQNIIVPTQFTTPPPTLNVPPPTIFPVQRETIHEVSYPSSSSSAPTFSIPPTSNVTENVKKSNTCLILEQPKPPGLEDEDLPIFPTIVQPKMEISVSPSTQKFLPKTGIVLSVKRKVGEDGTTSTPVKTPRTKSRWGQGPTE